MLQNLHPFIIYSKDNTGTQLKNNNRAQQQYLLAQAKTNTAHSHHQYL